METKNREVLKGKAKRYKIRRRCPRFPSEKIIYAIFLICSDFLYFTNQLWFTLRKRIILTKIFLFGLTVQSANLKGTIFSIHIFQSTKRRDTALLPPLSIRHWGNGYRGEPCLSNSAPVMGGPRQFLVYTRCRSGIVTFWDRTKLQRCSNFPYSR